MEGSRPPSAVAVQDSRTPWTIASRALSSLARISLSPTLSLAVTLGIGTNVRGPIVREASVETPPVVVTWFAADNSTQTEVIRRI